MSKVEASADEIRALLDLTQRVPMTRAEALFTEALFTRWLASIGAIEAPPANNDAPSAKLDDQRSDQPDPAVPAGAPSTEAHDQV